MVFEAAGFLKERSQHLIGAIPTQDFFQIELRLGQQTGAQAALGREAQAVAGTTVVLAHGADKSQFSRKSRGLEDAGRSGSGVGRRFRKLAQDCQPPVHLGHRQEVTQPILVGTRGHQFNESHLEGAFPGQVCQVQQFIIVDPLHRYTIDLHRMKSQSRSALYTR